MNHLLLALASALFVECLLRFQVLPRLVRFQSIARRIARVLGSAAISDHWKERVLPRYAQILMTESVLLLVSLAMALLPAAGILWVGAHFEPALLAWSTSGWALVEATVVALAYVLLRNRVKR